MDRAVQNAQILVVDDNPKNLQLLGAILSKQGYQIGIAQNGLKALESAKADLPDLILLDVMMPEMDGFETCEHFKNDAFTKDIPIIFLTAKTESEDAIRGFELGAIDYITKPFNTKELLVRVKNQLQLKFSLDIIQKQKKVLQTVTHILSHDLSNSLQVISVSLQMLEAKPESLDKMKSNIYLAVHNGKALLDLVNTIEALEEGKITLALAAVNLEDALMESFELLRSQFSRKNIRPVLKIEGEIHIIAEKISLVNSVFNNILTNAIKFSHDGSLVNIEVQIRGDNALITFKDAGIGIPQGILNIIFDMDGITTRFGTLGEKGTGFGMPLVKKFVTIYGGTIEVSSREESESSTEHGTEIQLCLKLSSTDSKSL